MVPCKAVTSHTSVICIYLFCGNAVGKVAFWNLCDKNSYGQLRFHHETSHALLQQHATIARIFVA